MSTCYKFIVSFGLISCIFGNNVTIPKIKYAICYSDSKHCIQCFQNQSVVIYEKPIPQEDYRIRLMDELNRVRSQYAVAHHISNMKFTLWVQEFEALSEALSSIDSPIIECSDLSNKQAMPSNYKILDYQAKTELDKSSKNLNKILQLQMDNFTRQMLNSRDMMAWNLNEFGCCYTFNMEGLILSTLFRCVLYQENRRQNVVLKSPHMCKDCERTSERCIQMDLYQGLCVPNAFNETRFRLLVTDNVGVSSQSARYISPVIWIIVGTLIFLLITVINILAYKVFCGRTRTQLKPFVYDRPPSAPAYNSHY